MESRNPFNSVKTFEQRSEKKNNNTSISLNSQKIENSQSEPYLAKTRNQKNLLPTSYPYYQQNYNNQSLTNIEPKLKLTENIDFSPKEIESLIVKDIQKRRYGNPLYQNTNDISSLQSIYMPKNGYNYMNTNDIIQNKSASIRNQFNHTSQQYYKKTK